MYDSVSDFILNRHKEGPYGLATANNAWLESYGIRVYLRAAERIINGDRVQTIDVANLASDNPGSGNLGHVIDEVETCTRDAGRTHVYIEHIFNERLRDWFERRGYTRVTSSPAGSPSYYKAVV